MSSLLSPRLGPSPIIRSCYDDFILKIFLVLLERTSSSLSSYKPISRTLGGRMSPHEFERQVLTESQNRTFLLNFFCIFLIRVDICTMDTSDQSSTTSSGATVVAPTYLTTDDHRNCGCCLCCVKTKVEVASGKWVKKMAKLFSGLCER